MTRWAYETYRCPCGNGYVYLDQAEDDHAWSSSTWFTADVRCPECRKVWSASVSDAKKVTLENRDDLTLVDKAMNRVYAASHAVYEISFQCALDKLRAVLGNETFPSMAAEYRCLDPCMSLGSIQTFRRDFRPSLIDKIRAGGPLHGVHFRFEFQQAAVRESSRLAEYTAAEKEWQLKQEEAAKLRAAVRTWTPSVSVPRPPDPPIVWPVPDVHPKQSIPNNENP